MTLYNVPLASAWSPDSLTTAVPVVCTVTRLVPGHMRVSALLCLLCAGTVIPPGLKLHLSPNVAAFRARANSPKAGEAVFVIQAPDSLLPSDGGSVNWSIVDENGSAVQLS